jgi:hypothetical protein
VSAAREKSGNAPMPPRSPRRQPPRQRPFSDKSRNSDGFSGRPRSAEKREPPRREPPRTGPEQRAKREDREDREEQTERGATRDDQSPGRRLCDDGSTPRSTLPPPATGACGEVPHSKRQRAEGTAPEEYVFHGGGDDQELATAVGAARDALNAVVSAAESYAGRLETTRRSAVEAVKKEAEETRRSSNDAIRIRAEDRGARQRLAHKEESGAMRDEHESIAQENDRLHARAEKLEEKVEALAKDKEGLQEVLEGAEASRDEERGILQSVRAQADRAKEEGKEALRALEITAAPLRRDAALLHQIRGSAFPALALSSSSRLLPLLSDFALSMQSSMFADLPLDTLSAQFVTAICDQATTRGRDAVAALQHNDCGVECGCPVGKVAAGLRDSLARALGEICERATAVPADAYMRDDANPETPPPAPQAPAAWPPLDLRSNSAAGASGRKDESSGAVGASHTEEKYASASGEEGSVSERKAPSATDGADEPVDESRTEAGAAGSDASHVPSAGTLGGATVVPQGVSEDLVSIENKTLPVVPREEVLCPAAAVAEERPMEESVDPEAEAPLAPAAKDCAETFGGGERGKELLGCDGSDREEESGDEEESAGDAAIVSLDPCIATPPSGNTDATSDREPTPTASHRGPNSAEADAAPPLRPAGKENGRGDSDSATEEKDVADCVRSDHSGFDLSGVVPSGQCLGQVA